MAQLRPAAAGSPRPARRWICLFATVLAASLAGASEAGPDRPLASGVWRGELGRWTVVLEFSDGGGQIEGVAHILDGHHKWSEAVVTGVTLDPPRLEWHLSWGPSLQQDFRGRVDFAGGSIEGELSISGGPTVQARFDRTKPEAVAGMMARASLAEYSWVRPPEISDGWSTGTAENDGLERSRIEALMREVIRGDAGDIHSLLIVENGVLVAEEYFHGWTREELHPIASCTKSVTSLLVGRVLDEQALKSLDAPVLELVPELAESTGQGWESVRLEHLLTMTAGLGRPQSAEVEIPGRSLFLQLLQRAPETPPGTRWQYANADVDLLGPVLRRATGLDPDEYAASVLFAPLGIEVWEWPKYDVSFPSMASGLSLRPRDMAKIGALVAGRGQWQGRRIVSKDWIERSTRVHVSPPGEVEQYGYLWWSTVPPGGSEEHRIVYAKGVGSQFIVVAPTLDLVITVTGGNHGNGKLMAIGELLIRHLLSAPPSESPSGSPPAEVEEGR